MSTWARVGADILMPTIGNGASAIITDPVECAALRINDGLQMWLGSWALDTSQGFPWPQILANKNPNLIAAANKLKSAILLLGAPVVIAVPSAALAFVQQTRSMAYSFQALAQTGAMLIGGSNGPAGLPYVVVQGSGSP
jgi:hypothetical protein